MISETTTLTTDDLTDRASDAADRAVTAATEEIGYVVEDDDTMDLAGAAFSAACEADMPDGWDEPMSEEDGDRMSDRIETIMYDCAYDAVRAALAEWAGGQEPTTDEERAAYASYRHAVTEAYVGPCGCHDPELFRRCRGEWYVGPSTRLVPNDDVSMGLCYIDADTGTWAHGDTAADWRRAEAAADERD